MRYELIEQGGSEGITVSTLIRNFSSVGISFYSFDLIRLNTVLKISFYAKKDENIFFLARVRWIEKCPDHDMGRYIVGAQIEKIDDLNQSALTGFLSYVDIEKVLCGIDLSNVLDINFVGGYPPMVKRFDKVVPANDTVLSKESVQGLLLSILPEKQYRVFMREKEVNFIYTFKNKRFRVNLHFQQGRIEGIFRVIPETIKKLNELGLPASVEKMIASHRRGLILITGRTGSGKTTTLSSMVEYINNLREGIIISVEDPVEYVHSNKKCIIKQREVGKDTNSFYNAAKNALRQNPDVLVIGEILDADTMDVALTMAESGTLVLATFHAPNSVYALDRVVSLFPSDLQGHILSRMSLILIGIITQQLVPSSDGKDFLLASEVVIVNDALRRIIRTGDWKQIPTVLQTSRNKGMQSMSDSLKFLYEQGCISGEYLQGV